MLLTQEKGRCSLAIHMWLPTTDLKSNMSWSKLTRANHREVALFPINELVQALRPKQVHDLPLLMRLHPAEDHNAAHDGVQQVRVCQLQQLLKSWPCHTALRFPLYPALAKQLSNDSEVSSSSKSSSSRHNGSGNNSVANDDDYDQLSR